VPSGTYAGRVVLPPNGFFGGGHIVDGSSSNTAHVPLIHLGKIMSGGGIQFCNPVNPDNENDPLKGKWFFRYNLDILSRATATDSFTRSTLTKYMKQSFAIRAVPLFSNAVYYNMDMEVQPGPNMTITGSTHTNGRLFARSASDSPTYITFAGPVTAVKGMWTNFHTSSGDNLMPYFQSYNETGALQTNATTGLVQILPAGSTTPKAMRLTADTVGYAPNLTNGTWVESTWDLHPTTETWQQHLGDASPPTETVASKASFANWIQQTFLGNLLTNVNGLTPNRIQGIPDYSYTYGSTYPDPSSGTADACYTYKSGGNDINNSAHALIETPRLTGAASYNASTEAIKYAHRVGLYISVNTDPSSDLTGHKPDGTTMTVKAHSYRAFKTDGTEVLLPGQDTFGDTGTANPNATHKNAHPIIMLNNIGYDSSASSSYNIEQSTRRQMVDMRRVDGSFDQTAARSGSNIYVPKNLYMIDLDMMELKKAVRTIAVSTGTTATTNSTDFYDTGLPTSTNYANFIYYASATPKNVTVGDTTRIINASSTAGIANAFSASDWNGAVYIESIAADQFDTAGSTTALRKKNTHNKHNSGVRIINGRGKVPSLNNTDTTGFTLATNDAVYVLGTFNADGLSTTPSPRDRLVPTSPGESTGHFYETGELPASIVADAVYLLSQPNVTFDSSHNPVTQDAGWNDVYSSYCNNAEDDGTPTDWSTSWDRIAPSSTNKRDGNYNTAGTVKPYKVPYDSDSGAWSSGGQHQKLPASFSEYSFAMLCGLVPTGKNGVNQTSGGLHNFPRFLEDWGGVECRIRGSMVALFECRVANDPWNLRVYSPPNRIWGYNLLFASGVMPPLTPKTIQIRRVGANDITKDDYNVKLNAWGYTPLP